jgi:hypothetical protein
MQFDAVGRDAGLAVQFVHKPDSVEANGTMDVLP